MMGQAVKLRQVLLCWASVLAVEASRLPQLSDLFQTYRSRNYAPVDNAQLNLNSGKHCSSRIWKADEFITASDENIFES